MKIKSFRILNYKSWADSNEVPLNQGMNIVLGQNNAGKSALLDALSLRGGHKPHRSIVTLPNPLSQFPIGSTIKYNLSFSKSEILELLRNVTGNFCVPSTQEDSAIGIKMFNDWITSPQIMSADFENNNVTRVGPENFYSEYNLGHQAMIDPVTREPVMLGRYNGLGNLQDLFFYRIIDQVKSKIYFFHAERYNIGQAQVQDNKILSSKAENLAQVLNHLMSNDKERFEKYVWYVNKVLPQVKDIIVPPSSNNNSVQVKIWTVKPIPGRSDLAMPLSECGTGVGQVLAMLYVIVNSDYPQCLLIDEPQSFLHPGAVRSLMEIFKMFDYHQYVIASHSPFFLNEDAQILHIHNDGVNSSCEIIPISTANDHRLILEDLGAKLSDVSGADGILWVEGLTEEHCYKLISKTLELVSFSRIEIIGVRSTGELEGKHAEVMYRIYTKLSKGTSVIPPAVGFIFDRELRTDKDCEDLKRESKGLVEFTARRMYENYLLHLESITTVVNEVIEGANISTHQIKSWIEDNGLKPTIYESKIQTDVFSDHWLKVVHGGRLFQMMFADLSAGKTQYDKVRHGIKLTRKILEVLPKAFDEITVLILQSLNKKPV